MEPATDRELWQEAVAGSSGSFGLLFDRHAGAVYHHCFRLCGSWSAAEDALQTTFLTAWRKRQRVRLERDDALPWLLTVATNTVRGQRRALRRWLNLLDRMPRERGSGDHADEVSARVDDERAMTRLLVLTRRLPRAEREALALVVWSGVSYPDAAAQLGIAEASVRSRVSRARSRLARLAAAAAATTAREGQPS
jgi:RNA polymerase sigma factor (sigma-70 family)